MAEKSKPKQAKMPLKLRLKAWWEGYDPDEIQRRLQGQNSLEGGDAEAHGVTAPPPGEAEEDVWSDEQVNIAQYIWGEGYCGPGGPDYIVMLSKLLALSPEMSMLQLGAAIGGPARVLADRFGVWITGYETSHRLVTKGNELSKKQGMEKKAALEYYDPENFDGFDRKYDRALAKEALFAVKDKKAIVNYIEEKLKPGGLLLITDYMLGSDGAVGKDLYKEWKIGEREDPCPIMPNEMTDILKKAQLQVRVSEDLSLQYIEMINKAWAGADEVAAKLAKQENGAEMIQILMREAEFWTRRKKLLEEGDLQLWRMVAAKKADGPSGMSDW